MTCAGGYFLELHLGDLNARPVMVEGPLHEVLNRDIPSIPMGRSRKILMGFKPMCAPRVIALFPVVGPLALPLRSSPCLTGDPRNNC